MSERGHGFRKRKPPTPSAGFNRIRFDGSRAPALLSSADRRSPGDGVHARRLNARREGGFALEGASGASHRRSAACSPTSGRRTRSATQSLETAGEPSTRSCGGTMCRGRSHRAHRSITGNRRAECRSATPGHIPIFRRACFLPDNRRHSWPRMIRMYRMDATGT